jgi:glycerophosphoryl diester phosphodiesterase
VIFGSFFEDLSTYKDEKYPDLVRGAYPKELIRFYLYSFIDKKDYEPAFSVLQLPFNDTNEDHHINLGTVQVINYAHAHNLAVQYWTINTEADATYLMEIGADCITTDVPDVVYRLREAMK